MSDHALSEEIDIAERKAWDALARYKFWMFGYWAGVWVHLNRISGQKRPNPWAELVKRAKQITSSADFEQVTDDEAELEQIRMEL